MSMRKPATRPTATSGAIAKQIDVSRIDDSVDTSNDHSGAAACRRLMRRSSNAAVVPGRTLIIRFLGGRSRRSAAPAIVLR